MSDTSRPDTSALPRYVLFVCVALFALGQFHRAAGSVFSPLVMERFALSASAAGLMVSSLFLASVLTQVPAGVALDRAGPRWVLLVAIFWITLCTLGFALSHTPVHIAMSRAGIGIGLAAVGAATQVLLARTVSPRQYGYANGLVVSLGGIGGLLGTFPLAVSLERFSWMGVFTVVFVATVCIGFSVLGMRAPSPAQVEADNAATTPNGYRWLLQQPDLARVLVLAIVSYAPITTVTGLWGGPYLQRVLDLSPDEAGAVLLGFFGATIVAGYVFGLLDRHLRHRRRLIIGSAAVSTVSLLVLAALPEPGVVLSIGLLMLMVFTQQFYVPLGAHLRRIVPPAMLGRAVAAFSFVAVLAIPVMQTGFGLVLDVAGNLGATEATRFRIAFALVAVSIAVCTRFYAGSRLANDEFEEDASANR